MQNRVVGNRYEIGELIGYGGMAEVHRGRDVRLGRDVAVKILRSDLARDPAFLARFRREAQSSAGLNHQAIVAVYDTGEEPASGDQPEIPYIVMEYVEGRTLRDVIKEGGALPFRQAMEIVSEICAALEFSHRNGIVHRDIKPANVMITPSGRVKVMDFGIARALSDGAATATQTANVIGTAQYLSPEQARGESVDARSDVYSVGCLMYELITGQPPFQGDSPVAVAYQHVRENAPIPSAINAAIPRELDSITMKALAKNPLNRYQSAGEMRQDLQRAIQAQPVQAEAVLTDEERTQFIARVPTDGPTGTGRRRVYAEPEDDGRRNGLIWLAIVVALLLVIGAAAYAVVLVSNKNQVKKITVPTAINLTEADARAKLGANGDFQVTVSTQTSGGPCGIDPSAPQTVLDDHVCTQNPSAGTEQPKGTTITLTLFKTPQAVVGTYKGLNINAALLQISKDGLTPNQTPVDSLSPAGTVLSQDPLPGVGVTPNSVVKLTVSSGVAPIPVVTDLTVAEAKLKLSQVGFTSVSVSSTMTPTSDLTKNGLVASYAPTGGRYPAATAIVLTVYEYKKPPATCTTAPPTTSSSNPPTSPTKSPRKSRTPTPSDTPTTPVTSPTSTGLPACR